jgi:hypothetical protein
MYCVEVKKLFYSVEHIKAELNIKADVNIIQVINEIIGIIFHFPLAVFICWYLFLKAFDFAVSHLSYHNQHFLLN